ncbi:biotin-dependent carboxyltransferase family protein [Salicibibacter cibarius]|uniref:Biotin-dependent carboxyltransferase family protein n=1 Tax=Salicibibacter cibarius TaxID=2743000 RepID=A0A7T7CAD2_9BACI|nr:biotin-dependent carboxyltransferase family protein [Salicibibacter cibarius]QQK74774.1 biotin-dependent carboxyltransferase family protein [Salicibibacter cibarius]
MSLFILKAGLFTTIQDRGRIGFLQQGVLESGAMDRIALQSANAIVGNHENEAVLEMTMNGPEVKVERDSLIAVTGGGMVPTVNGTAYSLGVPLFVPAESTLAFKPVALGYRAYLAVAGSLDVPVVMNSKSTYVRAGIGGLEGRPLKKGDRLHVGEKDREANRRFEQISQKADGSVFAENWGANGSLLDRGQQKIRAFPGTHFKQFTAKSRERFFQQSFTVSTQSDRMGYRLQAEEDAPIERQESFSLLSEPVAFGTVQVPSDGQPIVLMADRQTTGGYPRFAQVAAVDLGRVAQFRPNEKVMFEPITFQEAETLYLKQARAMRERKIGIALKWGSH